MCRARQPRIQRQPAAHSRSHVSRGGRTSWKLIVLSLRVLLPTWLRVASGDEEGARTAVRVGKGAGNEVVEGGYLS